MKIYPCTLTPCRSNPRRYIRLVVYRRSPDDPNKLDAYLVEEFDPQQPLKVEHLQWNQIRESDVDNEFAAAWAEHVQQQNQVPPLDH